MRSLAILLMLTLFSQLAFGCWMAASAPTKLQGTAIAGRFSYEGKPLDRSKVEILKDGKVLATTMTDKYGTYTLPVAGKGLYVIKMLNPSGESFEVEFEPSSHVQHVFKVDFFADYCYRIKAETN